MSSDDVVVSSSRRPVASIAPSIEKKLSVLKYHTGFLLYSICLIVFAVVGSLLLLIYMRNKRPVRIRSIVHSAGCEVMLPPHWFDVRSFRLGQFRGLGGMEGGGRRGGAGAAESSLPCEDKGSIAVQGTAIRLHLAQDKTLRSMRNAISSRSRVIESGFSQGLFIGTKVDVL